MIYNSDDISLEQLSPRDFERLCFELLMQYGFNELTWRQGGADSGRDIEGSLVFSNHISPIKTRWFFECKHYTSTGVPPAELSSKLVWADAEQPDYLVLFVSSYITTAARTWLDGIRSQKPYEIIVIEGPEFKSRLLQYPKLIEQFFSLNGAERLLKDVKDHWLKYKIEPSYEVLREIAEKIDPEKLTLNDLGFLFISFYKNYQMFETRLGYIEDFTEQVLEPLYDRLRILSGTEDLKTFTSIAGDVEYLGGNGCFDDTETLEETDLSSPNLGHQYYTFHLNSKKSQEHWGLGYYLFIITTYGHAVELFMLDNSDFTTESKVYVPYTPDVLGQLSLKLDGDFIQKVLKCFPDLNVAKEKWVE